MCFETASITGVSSRLRGWQYGAEVDKPSKRHALRMLNPCSSFIARLSSTRLAWLRAFCDHFLQGVMLEGEVSVHLLQPRMLVLEIFQPSQLRHFQARVLLLPVVIGRLRDLVYLRQVSATFAPGFDLFKDSDDLFFRKLRLLHVELLQLETLPPTDSNRRGDFTPI